MASTDCVTRIGFSGVAATAKGGKSSPLTLIGIGGAMVPTAGPVTSNTTRSRDWLLRADEVWIDPKTGRPSRRFYQLMREICENRLGGVTGRTVPQVVADVASTQGDVAANISYATQVGTYAQSVAATAQATAEVVQTSSLPGSETIPEPSEPPTYSPHVDPDDI